MFADKRVPKTYYYATNTLTYFYHPPEEFFSFPVAWHFEDPVDILSCNFIISFFLAAAVGTLKCKCEHKYISFITTNTSCVLDKNSGGTL